MDRRDPFSRDAFWRWLVDVGRWWMKHEIEISDAHRAQARKMKCPCQGAGSIVTFSNGKPFWWDCSGCGKDRSVTAFGPPTIRIHSLGSKASVQGHSFKLDDFPENALMAHVMAKANIFPSVGQARKNGWDRPIEEGVFTVTKKKIRIEVTK